MTSTLQAKARVDEQLRALRTHHEGTRAGVDAEELHQFRVGIRRLRSLLKGQRSLDPDGVLRAELRWIGAVTSPVRDLDVLLLRLRDDATGFAPVDRAAAEVLISALGRERGRHRQVLNRALSSKRYHALLDRLGELATSPDGEEPPEEPLSPKPRSLHKPFHRLAEAVAALGDDPPDDDLHALRIHGKRLRYAAETALPTAVNTTRRQLSALVKAGKAFQDVLGDHQDAVIAADRVREFGAAHENPAVVFVAGMLVERERAKQVEARAAWPGAWQRLATAAAPLV